DVRPVVDHGAERDVVAPVALNQILEENAAHLHEFTTPPLLGSALVEAGVLTAYQLERVLAGTLHGLVLGNYRVLDRMGGGSVCDVFLPDSLLLSRPAAVQVPPRQGCFPA